MSFFFCHYVILSKKIHLSPPRSPVILSSRPLLLLPLSSCYSVFKITLSPFVIMSFCLKKYICLPPSPCYSVFKTTPSVTSVLLLLCPQNYPVSLCHYVILSKKPHLSRPVPLLPCLQKLPCLATYITTYILLAIGFFVLYLCIVIRNEGMTNGVLMNQIIYNN